MRVLGVVLVAGATAVQRSASAPLDHQAVAILQLVLRVGLLARNFKLGRKRHGADDGGAHGTHAAVA